MRAVIFPAPSEPVPDLERLDRSLRLLLLARAATPSAEPRAGGARARGRDRRRTLMRWADELEVPRELAEALADAIFDRVGAHAHRREPTVTVELLLPAPRHGSPIVVAPEPVGVHSS